MARRRRHGTCIYCGEYKDKLEREDVFPRALFVSRDDPPILVPSCRPCNHQKSKFDGEFRDFAILAPEAWRNPDALNLLQTKFPRSHLGHHSGVGRAIDLVELHYVPTEFGYSELAEITAEIDPLPRVHVMGCIALGLIYKTANLVIADTHSLAIADLDSEQFDKMIAIAKGDTNSFSGTEGHNVAEWGITYAGEFSTPMVSAICFARFYGALSMRVLIAPKIKF